MKSIEPYCVIPEAAPPLPSTYGGVGWRPRTLSHKQEVFEDDLWQRCGLRSEVLPIKQVSLAWPSDSLRYKEPPADYLMLARPDLDTIRQQACTIAAFYNSLNIKVHWFCKNQVAPPNFIFQRDLFLMTPEGAILSRPASIQRAAEARFEAAALAGIGVPLLAGFHQHELFEGADALWLTPETLAVGIGKRTNHAAFESLKNWFGSLGVTVCPVELPTGIQHLLGVVNPIDHGLVAVRHKKLTSSISDLLQKTGMQRLEVGESPEVMRGGAMNFVTLSPGHIVMPADNPCIRYLYEQNGLKVNELQISEYLKAAGGLACLTGILERTNNSV